MIPRNRINKNGMSYAELLTVVIILAIVLAIAMPSVVTIQKQLNQTELDAKAETIYVAVQNKLSKMKAGGNTGIYQYTDSTNGVKKLLNIPGDADEDLDKVKAGDICYITSSELQLTGSASSVIVDADLMDESLRNSYWVVEYNPSSAIVYAVYYSEDVNCASEYDSAEFNRYDLYLRYRDNRLSDGAKVGYYGGGSAGASSAVTTMTPVLSVENAEKLEATVTCVLPSTITDYPVFKIELEDINGSKYTEYYAYWESSTG